MRMTRNNFTRVLIRLVAAAAAAVLQFCINDFSACVYEMLMGFMVFSFHLIDLLPKTLCTQHTFGKSDSENSLLNEMMCQLYWNSITDLISTAADPILKFTFIFECNQNFLPKLSDRCSLFTRKVAPNADEIPPKLIRI